MSDMGNTRPGGRAEQQLAALGLPVGPAYLPASSGGTADTPEGLLLRGGDRAALGPTDAVFRGTQTTSRTEMVAQPELRRAGRRDSVVNARVTQTDDVIGAAEAELARWYQMTPDERAAVQERLFVGGFYDRGLDAADIRWGDPDDDGFDAWGRAVARASRMFAAGQRATVADVLNAAYGPGLARLQEAAASGGEGRRGAARTVSVSSVASLVQLAEETGRAVLGRKATSDEQRLVMEAVRRAQTTFQMAGSGEVPDPQAIAVQTLRESAPVEASGQDFTNTYGMFVRMLGGMG